MAIEEMIVATLAAAPALAGVRVFPEVAPDGAQAPYIVYAEAAENPLNLLVGGRAADLENHIFQFDVYAKSKAQAVALKTAISTALQEEKALGAVLRNGGSMYEPDTKLFRQRQDFSLWNDKQ
jgi:hypothetical protein